MKSFNYHKEPSAPANQYLRSAKEKSLPFFSNSKPFFSPQTMYADTHILHQQNSSPVIQKSPLTNVSVEDCLKQKTGDLLPGKVGVVEHINREVMLDEILGKQRKKIENEIRQDYDARKFVCEAGISAMLALYYNRDYKNRLHVELARKNFSEHPEYYSLAGIDATKQTKEMLKKKYNIFMESGDKDWSPEDIGLLAEALGKLTEKEIPLISNYHFIRWTSRCNQLIAKNADYECEFPEDYNKCGLHETDVVDRKYTITMYDCMKDDGEDKSKQGYNVRTGADTIIHEIGHAMEFGKQRLALERATDTKKEYGRIKRQYDAATTADAKRPIEQKLKAAEKKKDDAAKELDKILAGFVIDQFKKLIKNKRPLTPYAATSATEAFAEAFMLFKVAPGKLKKLNKPLFDWFSKGGFM
jgi:hypothetical protein